MYLPRKPREHSVTNLYHIIIRGIDRNDIFYDNQDRYVFLNILKETKERFKFEIYSYCLMNNHIHIVFRIKDEFLSKSMQSLEIRYSAYFNKKINRNGHLFQNRFLSKKIENLKDIIDEILSEKNIVLEREVKKKFKTVDIRPMIYSLEVDNSGENSIINTRIATGSQGNLKIDLLMEYIYKKCNIEYIPIKLKTTRYEMYTEKDGELVAL